jgi:hypothetical protein
MEISCGDSVSAPDRKTPLKPAVLEPQTNTRKPYTSLIQGEFLENSQLIKLTGLKAD